MWTAVSVEVLSQLTAVSRFAAALADFNQAWWDWVALNDHPGSAVQSDGRVDAIARCYL